MNPSPNASTKPIASRAMRSVSCGMRNRLRAAGYSQIAEDAARGLAAFEHGGDDQVRATHHVTASEHFRVRGLKWTLRRPAHAHAIVRVQTNAGLLEPCGRIGQEPECNDDGIGAHHFFGARDRLGNAAAPRAGLAQPRLHELDPLDSLGADDLDRLAIEEKVDALFPAVLVIAPRPWHVQLVPPVRARDRLGALADCRAVAIHARVAAAEHDDAL